MLAASIARLHRERPTGWAAAVAAQAARLALHTGYLGADEWADAIAAQLAAREIELDDAIDALHTACYLAEGVSAGPCVHAARVLLEAGRAPAALAVLTRRPRAPPTTAWRDRSSRALADAVGGQRKLDVPLAFEQGRVGDVRGAAEGRAGARREARALGRRARSDATPRRTATSASRSRSRARSSTRSHHLVRGTREQATQILSGVLYQTGKLPEAMAVLDYASRWYVRAEQWLTYGGVAYAAMDNPRTRRRRTRSRISSIPRRSMPASSMPMPACSTRSATTRPARRSRTSCCASRATT